MESNTKQVILNHLRAHGIYDLLELVRECAEEIAEPESEDYEARQCYTAVSGIDDVLEALDEISLSDVK